MSGFRWNIYGQTPLNIFFFFFYIPKSQEKPIYLSAELLGRFAENNIIKGPFTEKQFTTKPASNKIVFRRAASGTTSENIYFNNSNTAQPNWCAICIRSSY